ncbi:MAG: phasin family protein [Nevskia sp.]|nr:phasin family protein [Nevskia sp.]
MAAKQHLNQLKQQIERLRKDSLDVVASANKIVYNGVQKLADRELKALNDYYRGALDSIKKANRNDIRGLAQQQLDLLQDTVNQVISHARESMGIVAETRAELSKLVQKGIKGEKVAMADLNKAAAPARKAIAKAKTAAQKAGKDAQKSVKKVSKQAQATTRKAVASGKRTATAAIRKVEHAVIPPPSPGSRASRATSRAKQAATTAVESVGSVVSGVTGAVSGAVTRVTDAVKKQA